MATRALYPTTYDEETKIWSGMSRAPFFAPDCSVGSVLFNAMKNWPTQTVLINHEDGRRIANAEMRALATRLALFLKKEKLNHNDVVGIIGVTSTYLAPLAVGCFFNTTPFHAVAVNKEASVIKGLYELTKPKIMFCDGNDYERIKEVTKEWAPKFITLTGRVEGVPSIEDLLNPTMQEHFYQPEPLAIDGDQTALILCSSGTSGLPKAVAISHKHVTRIAPFCNSTDIILTNATLDWATGFISSAIGLIYGVQKVIFERPFEAGEFIGMIKQYNVSILVLKPWQTYELFNHPLATEESLANIRVIFITGCWLSTKILQRGQSLMKKCLIVSSYGATETGAITANIDHSHDDSLNNVGRIFPGMRIKIIDEDGNALPHNKVGEVLIDIGSKWLGYLGSPADTEATLQDGWINLGDLGYFDNDNNLILVDRKKDLLKYKSNHYWPTEIEQIIAELPEVLNVCVVGIPDPCIGELAGALVIKKPGATITEQQIIDHVAKRVVVEYKQLHSGVKFVDTLPLNPNGKMMRNLAKQVFLA
ncbi:luciferin 4-monooxygenase [Drosophila sulfurigaster albostrigata]|uniref:luciferin 4-monooxygenase n=1 Tax=Drosophila sulfurigaster albostrigata TaxID=89887 RepID=UPI002D21A6CD|nr:luciferin 4-monooxygenase [Drosophila sulfurigaster albostrigata]